MVTVTCFSSASLFLESVLDGLAVDRLGFLAFFAQVGVLSLSAGCLHGLVGGIALCL